MYSKFLKVLKNYAITLVVVAFFSFNVEGQSDSDYPSPYTPVLELRGNTDTGAVLVTKIYNGLKGQPVYMPIVDFVDMYNNSTTQIAYLTENGSDATGRIGNIFRPYSTLNGINADYKPSSIKIVADNKEYSNLLSFNSEFFAYEGDEGGILNNYNNISLFEGTATTNVAITGGITINTDTLSRSGALITSTQKDSLATFLMDIEKLNCITIGNVSNFRSGLMRSQFKNVEIKINELNINESSLMSAINTNNRLDFAAEVNRIIMINATSTFNTTREVVFLLKSEASKDQLNGTLNVDYFYNNNVDGAMNGLVGFSRQGQIGTYDNSNFTVNINTYISNKIASRASYNVNSSNTQTYQHEMLMWSSFENSTININIKKVYGSHILGFGFFNDAQRGDYDNVQINYDIGSANVRYNIYENTTALSLVNNSNQNIRCGDCLITDDVAIKSFAVVDATSKFSIHDSRIEVTKPTYPVFYVKHDLHLQDVQLFNDGIAPLIDSGATPIIVYACNTNLLQTRVGANVTIIFCDVPASGGGVTDLNFAEDNLTFSGDRTHNLAGNDLNIENGANHYFKLRDLGAVQFAETKATSIMQTANFTDFKSFGGITPNILRYYDADGSNYIGLTSTNNLTSDLIYTLKEGTGVQYIQSFKSSGVNPVGVTTPDYLGQLYFDETGKASYVATGLTNTDWAIQTNIVRSCAEMYIEDTAPQVLTLVSGVPSKVIGQSFDAAQMVGFSYATGTFTKTSTGTQQFKFDGTMSTSFATSNTVLKFYVRINNVVVGKIAYTRKIGTSGDIGDGGINGIYELSQNDDVEIWVTSDNSSDLTTVQMNFTLIQVD